MHQLSRPWPPRGEESASNYTATRHTPPHRGNVGKHLQLTQTDSSRHCARTQSNQHERRPTPPAYLPHPAAPAQHTGSPSVAGRRQLLPPHQLFVARRWCGPFLLHIRSIARRLFSPLTNAPAHMLCQSRFPPHTQLRRQIDEIATYTPFDTIRAPQCCPPDGIWDCGTHSSPPPTRGRPS